MPKSWIILLLINSISIVLSFDNINWISASNSSCGPNTNKASTELLLKCDKLITPQRKKSLTLCISEITNGKGLLDDKKPIVCSYMENENMNYLNISECMINNTNTVYADLKKLNPNQTDFMWAVEAADNDFNWCLTKIVRPLGYEHICDLKLTQQQIESVKACDSKCPGTMLKVLKHCGTEFKLKDTGRPLLCDYYENTKLQRCFVEKSRGTGNDWNGLDEYYECLSKISL